MGRTVSFIDTGIAPSKQPKVLPTGLPPHLLEVFNDGEQIVALLTGLYNETIAVRKILQKLAGLSDAQLGALISGPPPEPVVPAPAPTPAALTPTDIAIPAQA